MKKILVGLVALALAGGGAFAQGWTFNGLVDGGLGIFILEDEDYVDHDDMYVAPITREGTRGFRTQLVAAFVNESNTAGLNFRIRAQGTNWGLGGIWIDYDDATGEIEDVGFGTNLTAFFDFAFGWVTLFDGLATIQGGRVDNGMFVSQDRMWNDDSGEGLGLFLILDPIENLRLGFAGFSRHQIYDSPLFLGGNDSATGVVAFSYVEPDLFRLTGGFRGVGTLGASQAYFSFAYLGMEDMHAAVTARFRNLEEFGDYGIMNFYATLAHSGLVDGLTLHLGGSLGMTMEDERLIDGEDVDSNLHIWAWAGVEFALMDGVFVPRLDFHWVSGGHARANGGAQSLHLNTIVDGHTFFDEENSFIRVQPSVQLRVAPNAFTEIGAIIHNDLGDNNTWVGGNGLNMAAYALVRGTF